MSKTWHAYAHHILDAINKISGFRNILVHNYLGEIDPLTVSIVITTHLQALQDCMQAMLNSNLD